MRKIVFYILMLSPVILVAQEITLKGTVIDRDSKTSLPGVSILIKKTSKGVFSDFDGNFETAANNNID